MEKFVVVILAVAIFAGVRSLFTTMITGTTTGELMIVNTIPLMIAVIAVALVIKILF